MLSRLLSWSAIFAFPKLLLCVWSVKRGSNGGSSGKLDYCLLLEVGCDKVAINGGSSGKESTGGSPKLDKGGSKGSVGGNKLSGGGGGSKPEGGKLLFWRRLA